MSVAIHKGTCHSFYPAGQQQPEVYKSIRTQTVMVTHLLTQQSFTQRSKGDRYSP
ncbi:hypothetical protein H6F86_01690 [Phormidium sp. FACHB-592]|uniref:Uncharacterized protein n=1 Tax=Stenomitos frigidus AS-A4 TaxID=2933935 RepID=A0ABV0KLY4_9CYAN|nr:hypothetical protein [Phormidium sp. FACHB-592]MBD2072617.1 hypothetical protein [Phormidium sp. FACHB-592]